MRRAPRLGLIGLNLALLGALAAVTWQGHASAGSDADPARQPARSRGQYILTAGRMQGATSHAIFVLDVINQELAALQWDRSGQRLVVMGYRNLAADAAASQGR